MNILLYLPLIICFVGLLIYALVSDAKAQEVGRLMFFAGLLAYLLKGIG